MSNISLTTLGGVRENGKNMYIAEIDGSIFVLDAGLKYPENEQLGVDVVIPNMDYLFENSDRIAGVFLTHGHADAIGALPYLLAEAKVPVFGSELTIELAKLFVKGNDTVKKFNDFQNEDLFSKKSWLPNSFLSAILFPLKSHKFLAQYPAPSFLGL